MSRGQKPRTQQHFPHMRWRARKRWFRRFEHYSRRYIIGTLWERQSTLWQLADDPLGDAFAAWTDPGGES